MYVSSTRMDPYIKYNTVEALLYLLCGHFLGFGDILHAYSLLWFLTMQFHLPQVKHLKRKEQNPKRHA